MKCFTLLSLSSLIGSALCDSLSTSALFKRDCTSTFSDSTYTSILSLVQDLQTTTDTFNTNVASTHDTFASDADSLTATAAYEAEVLSLTTAFTTTTTEIEALTGIETTDVSSACLSVTKRGEWMESRQTTTNITEIEEEIEAAIESIISEITTGIDTIKADLGLGKLSMLCVVTPYAVY